MQKQGVRSWMTPRILDGVQSRLCSVTKHAKADIVVFLGAPEQANAVATHMVNVYAH
jgi:hypothetical protein